MSRAVPESFLTSTRHFFHNYLQRTHGARGHMGRAYRDTLEPFFLFPADQKHKPLAELSLGDIQSEAMLAFVDHVES